MSLFNNKLQKVQLSMLDTDVQNKFSGYDTSLAQKAQQTDVDYLTKRDIIKHYGAITTGTTYPLSNKFATLADAQAKYPNAGITTLTKELNWAIFNQAFYDADTQKFELTIPAASYYIKDPLNPIGSSQADKSIEYANFGVKGEGVGRTILLFSFAGDTTWAMDAVANVQRFNIGGFTIKNLQGKQGCGLRIRGAFGSNITDILSYNFYIGADLTTYVSNVKNVVAGYCSCGIIWRNGTSTSVQNCYASNSRPRDANDTADWSGVGHYILGYVYTSMIALAADNCSQPYKVAGTSPIRLDMITLGAEQGGAVSAVYINNPNAYISLDGCSLDGINSLANVQAVGVVEIKNVYDYSVHNIVMGANVTPGQVRIMSKLPTISNSTLMTGKTPSIQADVKGNGDLIYDFVNYYNGSFMQVGRGFFRIATAFECTISLPANGNYCSLNFDVTPLMYYITGTNFGAGKVIVNVFNNGSLAYNYKSTDTNISVTFTVIDATHIKVTVGFVATSTVGLLDVKAYHNVTSSDQNIKANRTTLTIKGVDY